MAVVAVVFFNKFARLTAMLLLLLLHASNMRANMQPILGKTRRAALLPVPSSKCNKCGCYFIIIIIIITMTTTTTRRVRCTHKNCFDSNYLGSQGHGQGQARGCLNVMAASNGGKNNFTLCLPQRNRELCLWQNKKKTKKTLKNKKPNRKKK